LSSRPGVGHRARSASLLGLKAKALDLKGDLAEAVRLSASAPRGARERRCI
jgi:hypothetical protein